MNHVTVAMLGLGVSEMLGILLGVIICIGLVGGIALLAVWLARRGQSPKPGQPQPQVPPSPSPTTPPAAVPCPRCGAPLPINSPQGLCPRCVLGVGLATQTDATDGVGPHGTKIIKPPPAPDEIAKHFPQFEILECLGRGGMGVVYKARQPKLNRIVALKVLAPEKVAEPRFAERFEREAQALARLNHPNIVTVYDFGEADGLYYLTMEFVDGMSLRQLLQARKIAPEEALAIVPKICEALQFAHEQGVVHRDIKPENVLLDKQGRVKIADFGIAKIVGGTPLTPSLSPSDGERVSGRTGEGALTQDQVLGTPHYMAPEQREHPESVDHRADIYSLGVVFYELLTGELPLGKFQPPSQRVHIDVRLDEVVLRALAKQPELRYQQAGEVKTQLETIVASARGPLAEPGVAPGSATNKFMHESPGTTLDGARYLPIAKWVSIGLAILVFGWFAFGAYFAATHHRYSATTTISLTKAEFPIPASWIVENAGPEQLVKMPVVMDTVISNLNLNAKFAARHHVAQLPQDETRSELANRIFVSRIPHTDSYQLTVVGDTAGEPAPIADEISRRLVALTHEGPFIFPDKRVVEISERATLNKDQTTSTVIVNLVIGLILGGAVGRLVYGLSLMGVKLFGKTQTGPPVQKPDRFWRRFAVAVAALVLAVILIPVGAILLPMFARVGSRATHQSQQVKPPVAAATNASPVAAQTLSFGPVIEQEFTNSTLLDLDSGRIATEWPESVTTNGIVKNVLTAFDWMDREGLDFAYLENDGTFGIGLKVKNLTPDDWGNTTSTQLVNALASFRSDESRTGLNYGSSRTFVYGFKTREGGIGLLQLTGFTNNPPGVKIRYKLVQKAAAPPANPVVAQPISFGPVIERVIEARQTGTNLFLDLDSGKLLSPTEEVRNAISQGQDLSSVEQFWRGLDIVPNTRPYSYIAWLRENGADLRFDGKQEIIAFEGVFAAAHGHSATDWNDWTGITPEQVRSTLKSVEKAVKNSDSGITYSMSLDSPGKSFTSATRLHSRYSGNPPVDLLTQEQSGMWFFKTREGGIGILQIIGFTDNPRGVKIRYKLVQTGMVLQSESETPVVKETIADYNTTISQLDYWVRRERRLLSEGLKEAHPWLMLARMQIAELSRHKTDLESHYKLVQTTQPKAEPAQLKLAMSPSTNPSPMVKLLSVEDHSAPGFKMWQPDGSEVAENVRSVLTNGWRGSSPGGRWFSVLVSNAPDESLVESWAARIGRDQISRFSGRLETSRALGGTVVHFPSFGAVKKPSTDMRFGFAVKPWRTLLGWEGQPLKLVQNNWPDAQTVEEIDIESLKPQRIMDYDPFARPTHWTVKTNSGSAIYIKLPENKRSIGTWMLEVTDRQGRQQRLRFYSAVANSAGDWTGGTIWNVDVRPEDIRAITLKGLFADDDYQWTDFGDVLLQPNSASQ